ncbi:glycerol-3-phosphate 1-O-acyltransferase PlsY [Amylibacter sp. SFDW26]|uniref:glycerol-3-phosphate 1-O-acyltransferase PlsY n=1 Tax=Amylibacter sp. SFDW26 TaxID=2652722 RepID=UPI0012616CD6|nr:glycerol-3-phosphate 1-O-acyltransferase PlsY [Amylibacter sp. SFDW26]KAB7613968.1 glycerol-3-phosphate 1-O-acyltransferase PlsY [Amylibacter sp. SFDW26]
MLPIDFSPTTIIAVASLSYLLGAIPFGMVLAHIMGLGNLRDIGSGNIGATNVLRTGNKFAAFLTLVFDAGKGATAVLIASHFFGNGAALVAGLFAFLGHLYPVWLNFKGGKGVATFLGIMLALNFWAGFAACMTWLATAIIIRISSASALVAAALSPVWLYVFGHQSAIIIAVIMALLIWRKHSANITRIKDGTEPKIGSK